MSGQWTWILACAALAAGWFGYGWRGIVLALSVIAFWLLLEFSRTMRVLRRAAQAPLGHVASAVMLQSKLSEGMPMADIIKLTGSLGQKVRDEPETFAWRDDGGATVEVELQAGRCRRWTMLRAPDQE
jgi:hypothetical protein